MKRTLKRLTNVLLVFLLSALIVFMLIGLSAHFVRASDCSDAGGVYARTYLGSWSCFTGEIK